MSTETSGHDEPRWTLPPRKEISPENLHISSFVIVRNEIGDEGESILLLRAGDKHPLSFRRGKLMLPSVILRYGENPREGARRVLRDQLKDPKDLHDPEFFSMQSYLGAHWDIVFLFNSRQNEGAQDPIAKEPYVEAAFYEVKNLPRSEIVEDHLEVIDGALNPTDDCLEVKG
ncbi:MAG: NUDIX hydrolase [Thaumarchaeota archaeon]|nr:NUDIX hydrolase [Nitrososphaerota archaeon]